MTKLVFEQGYATHQELFFKPSLRSLKPAVPGTCIRGVLSRFRSNPTGHLLTVMRYVERNPVRANFIELAEDWQWSSAYARRQPVDERRWLAIPDDPALPRNWRSWVNKVETEAELTSLRHSVRRGLPYGDDQWTRSSAVRLGLQTTTRPRGRPKKET